MKDLTEVRTEVHTVTDLMAAIATAIRDGDVNMLLDLERLAEGWLQDDDEWKAQHELIWAALDAVEELAQLR